MVPLKDDAGFTTQDAEQTSPGAQKGRSPETGPFFVPFVGC